MYFLQGKSIVIVEIEIDEFRTCIFNTPNIFKFISLIDGIIYIFYEITVINSHSDD